MDDEHAEQIIRLLEEIRDGQRLQLERQAQALERQAEMVSQQRERLANLSKQAGEARARAEGVLVKSAKLVNRARMLILIALPFALLLFAFVIWALFARLAA